MRQLRRFILLAVPVLLLAACAPHHPDSLAQLPKLPQPPQRLTMIGSSFMPPAEPGWRVVGRNSTRLMLGRFGANPDEASIIMAGTTYTQIFHSRREFEAYIRSRVAGEAGRPDAAGGEVTMLRQRDSDCARVHMLGVDRQAGKHSGKPGDITFEIVELFCRHPDNDGVVSYLGYSQRYAPGNRAPDFDAKAATLLESLELSDF